MTIRYILSGIVLLVASGLMYAQSGSNPFELLPRMNLVEKADSSASGLVLSGNPFDLVKDASKVAEEEVVTLFPVVEDTHFLGEEDVAEPQFSKEEIQYRNFLFLSILMMFLLLTTLMTLFRHHLEKTIKAFLNDNLLTQIHREQGRGLSLPYLLFYLFYFFTAGIAIFIVSNHYQITWSTSNILNLAMFTGGFAALFIGKHLLLGILGYVFPIGKDVSIYSFTITIFGIVLGFLLVPANLLLAYGPSEAFETTLYVLLVLVVIIYLFRSLRALFIGAKYVALHKFHFLLYLCAVELAPTLVLVKLFLLNL